MAKVLSEEQKKLGFHKRDPKRRKQLKKKIATRVKNALRQEKRTVKYAQDAKRKELLEVQKERGMLHPMLTKKEEREIMMMDHRVRRRLFKTPDDFCAAADKYFNKIKEQNIDVKQTNRYRKANDRLPMIPYTFSGLLLEMGITKMTFFKYEKDERFKEYHGAAKVARMIIEDQLLTGGMKGEFNSQMVKFYLQNITDLREHVHVEKEEKIDHTITFITVNDRKELKQIEQKLKIEHDKEDDLEFEENEESGKRIVVSNVIDVSATEVDDASDND